MPAAVRHDAGSMSTAGADYVVGNRNRWSRVTLSFERLTAGQWYELNAYVVCDAAESALDVRDFAMLGVVFLSQDGSEIDFARVPGLARTSMDAHGDWLAGPAWEGGAGARAASMHRCFYLPAPAAGVAVVIRSWRNAHPFRIIGPEIRPADQSAPSADDAAVDAAARPRDRLYEDGRIDLGPHPVWFRHGLVPGRPLIFRGQVIAQGRTEGALAQICFRDAGGSPIPPPYPDTLSTLSVPAFLDIPVHRQAYRFTLKVCPPPQAATLEIGFGTWEAGPGLALAAAPDALLDDDLRLANLTDDRDPGAESVLARLLGRLGPPLDGAAGAGSIRPISMPPVWLSGRRRCAASRACGMGPTPASGQREPSASPPGRPGRFRTFRTGRPTRSGRRRGVWRSSPWPGPGVPPRVRIARFGSARSPSRFPGPARTPGASRRTR